MTTELISPQPKLQFLDSNGVPLSGGKLFTYQAGTVSTKQTTYTNSSGNTSNTNPIILDARGECNVWLDPTLIYKFVLAPPTDTDPPTNAIWTVDNLSGAVTFSTIILPSGAGMIGFSQEASYPQGTVGEALQFLVNPKNAPFNAVGGGADDTVAVQAAVDYAQTLAAANSGKRVTVWLDEIYYVARTNGTNDRWGIKITTGNITLTGPGGLARFNPNIVSAANAYPPLFVGTPDSNVAETTPNVTVDGLTFIGNNTNHGISGEVIHDFRNAIEAKNTTNLRVLNCNFTQIDSAVIFYQQPGTQDISAGVYYNKTKNYYGQFNGNYCEAVPHNIPNRNFIHAVAWPGIDYLEVSENTFIWCDDCAAGEGTYNIPSDIETNTYTYTTPASAAALGPLLRCGRGWQFIGNTCFNSSEHVYYGAGMDSVCSDNVINNDQDTICISVPIKERSRGSVISGNRATNYPSGILLDSPSFDVSVVGNGLYCTQQGAEPSTAITAQTDDLKEYIDNRPWLSGYLPMGNYNITGNSIDFATSAATGQRDIGVTVFTNPGFDVLTWPEGMIQGVNISGNTFRNHKYGVYIVGILHRTVSINGNTFQAKPFVSAGFSSGTTLNTVTPLAIDDTSTNAGIEVKFSDNYVNGANFAVSTLNGTGTAVELPWGMQGNKYFYVKNFKTADMQVTSAKNNFQNNTGLFFLDRTGWAGQFSLQNALNDGTNGDSPLKFNIAYVSPNLVFYTDDAGTTITLG